MRVEDLRFSMGWPTNLLARIWPFLFLNQLRDCDRPSRANRMVNCLDNMDIGEALQAGRFRLFVLQDAIREVGQFRRELVPLRKASGFPLSVDRHFQSSAFCVLVGRIRLKNALAPNELVAAPVGGSKTARKCRQPFARKTQYR